MTLMPPPERQQKMCTTAWNAEQGCWVTVALDTSVSKREENLKAFPSARFHPTLASANMGLMAWMLLSVAKDENHIGS